MRWEPQTSWHRQGRQSSHLWEPDANQTAINCPKENNSAHLSRKSIRKKQEVLHIRSIRIIRSFTVYFKNGFRWPKKLLWFPRKMVNCAWMASRTPCLTLRPGDHPMVGQISWDPQRFGKIQPALNSVEPLKIHLTSSHQRLAWVFFSEFGGGHLRSTFLDDANNEITGPGKRWHKAVTILVSVCIWINL